METSPPPTSNQPIRDAFGLTIHENPILAATSSRSALLRREHLATMLYWFAGKNPLQADLCLRREKMLPDEATKVAYLKQFRYWGQQMTQATIEGLAVQKAEKDYIFEGALFTPPDFFYPTIALDFIVQNYLPQALVAWETTDRKDLHDNLQYLDHQITTRVREVICLLGIYLEHAHLNESLSEHRLLLDRTIFTCFALNPVIRIGLPFEFGDFVRRNLVTIARYLYVHEKSVVTAFSEVPVVYYEQLLEALAGLVNLIPSVPALLPEDFA